MNLQPFWLSQTISVSDSWSRMCRAEMGVLSKSLRIDFSVLQASPYVLISLNRATSPLPRLSAQGANFVAKDSIPENPEIMNLEPATSWTQSQDSIIITIEINEILEPTASWTQSQDSTTSPWRCLLSRLLGAKTYMLRGINENGSQDVIFLKWKIHKMVKIWTKAKNWFKK